MCCFRPSWGLRIAVRSTGWAAAARRRARWQSSACRVARIAMSTICSLRSTSRHRGWTGRRLAGICSTGVGPFAIERGLVTAADGHTAMRVHLVNTGATVIVSIPTLDGCISYEGGWEISGVIWAVMIAGGMLPAAAHRCAVLGDRRVLHRDGVRHRARRPAHHQDDGHGHHVAQAGRRVLREPRGRGRRCSARPGCTIPVSTTHTITGAIVGVGSVTKLRGIRWGLATRIVWAWIHDSGGRRGRRRPRVRDTRARRVVTTRARARLTT